LGRWPYYKLIELSVEMVQHTPYD